MRQPRACAAALALGAALALTLAEAPAAAAPPAAPRGAPPTAKAPASGSSKSACLAAHEDAQTLRSEKKPHAAREKFVACARAECPVVVRKECVEQLAAVEKDAPTITLEARDESGSDAANIKVTMDGTTVAERLTGSALDVEPGEHVFRFERADGKVVEQRVLVVEGEKNRKVVAEFASPKRHDDTTDSGGPPPPPRESRAVPAGAWVASGIALVGFGSFGFFALSGKSKENKLASSCGPHCTDDEVRPVKTSYLVADISLAVGLVSTVVAVVLAWPSIKGAPVTTASTQAPRPWMPRVKVKELR